MHLHFNYKPAPKFCGGANLDLERERERNLTILHVCVFGRRVCIGLCLSIILSYAVYFGVLGVH